jgi:hypothetical protein
VYNHLAIRKLPIAHPQTRTAIEKVTRRVGTRNRDATPIQKREKTMAEPRAKATVEIAKVAKVRMGRNEKMNWERRKDCESG